MGTLSKNFYKISEDLFYINANKSWIDSFLF